jgi:predicted ATPase
LTDLKEVKVIEIPHNKNLYVQLDYGHVSVPSWLVSDGTLRLLALTLLAYLPAFQRTLMIEEPENGVHPKAVEAVFQSLSSVYESQVLLASHSPLILGLAKPEQLLCFAKLPDGSADIVRGDLHPALREWSGEVDLPTLYAAGVLG